MQLDGRRKLDRGTQKLGGTRRQAAQPVDRAVQGRLDLLVLVRHQVGVQRRAAIDGLAIGGGEPRQGFQGEVDLAGGGQRRGIDLAPNRQHDVRHRELQELQIDRVLLPAEHVDLPAEIVHRQGRQIRCCEPFRLPAAGQREPAQAIGERLAGGKIEAGRKAVGRDAGGGKAGALQLQGPVGLQKTTFGVEVELERARQRRAGERAQGREIGLRHLHAGLEPLRLEVDRAGGGQLDARRRGAQLRDLELLRAGLHHRERQAQTIAQGRGDVRRQHACCRHDLAVDRQRQPIVERDAERGIGPRQTLGIRVQSPVPGVERPLARQLQDHALRLRLAGQRRQQAALLMGAQGQLERGGLELQGRIQGHACRPLVGALEIERQGCRPAIVRHVELAGQRKARRRAHHLRAEIDLRHCELPHGGGRQPARQLRHADRFRRLGGRRARRQPLDVDAGGAYPIDPDTPAQQRARRPGQLEIIDLEPDAFAIGGGDPPDAHVDRHQPLQPRDLDRQVGRGQHRTELGCDQTLAVTGLRQAEGGGDQQDNQGQRRQKGEADTTDHGPLHKKRAARWRSSARVLSL